MKVGELIKRLESVSPEADVCVAIGLGGNNFNGEPIRIHVLRELESRMPLLWTKNRVEVIEWSDKITIAAKHP